MNRFFKMSDKLYFVFSLVLLFFINHCTRQPELAWQDEKGYRWAELSISSEEKTGFVKLSASRSGIDFSNNLDKEQIKQNRHYFDGSGLAIGDVDGDGLGDIYLCRLNGSNVLYRNQGNFRFEDITQYAGVAYADQFSKGALLADIDGDRDLDLIVTVLDGPNACFINDGTGKFSERTDEAGLASLINRTGNTSMAMGDIDGDGDLDLYMVCYKAKAWKDTDQVQFNSRGMILNRRDYGEPDILYLNDGKGHFKNVKLNADWFKREDGRNLPMPRAWGLTARMQDMDDDGDPDIYVCNDFFSPDFVWMNDGAGKFQLISRLAIRTNSLSAMTIDFSDIDRDGDLDFFIADMLSRDHQKRKMQMGVMQRADRSREIIDARPQIMRNTLYLNQGDGTYAEIANYSGLQASDWTWSAIFVDVDLDGYEDLLTTTGHAYDVQDSDTDVRVLQNKIRTIDELRNTIFMYPRLETPNYLFRNNGDLTFSEVGHDWGFDTNGISHGMAVGDLDNDGDLDVVTNNYQSPAGVYRNESVAPRIAVRLKGLAPNTHGIGAKIKLYGEPFVQSKEMIAGGQYLSSSDPIVVFAAGKIAVPKRLEVIWRSGKRSVIDTVWANRMYEIDEAFAVHYDKKVEEISDPVFEDVSHLIKHYHQERPFDDFYFQPLLPNRLSHLGPGVTWHDIDDDGDDDLLIASGRDGHMAVYMNEGSRGFRMHSDSFLEQELAQDQTTILATDLGSGETEFIIGYSNYENTPEAPSAVLYQFSGGRIRETGKLPAHTASSGPLVLADYDSDGDLDLFIGGRVISSRYPAPASSQLYLNNGEKYIADTVNEHILQNIGLISGAVFSDIDNDGDPDLLLAREWGPVTVLRNDSGVFSDATDEWGLSAYTGWWNGITSGDFNEDGRMDIVATNWGLNSKYSMHPGYPLKIYYDDFDNNGIVDIIEAYYDPMLKKMVPELGLSTLSNAIPFIGTRIHSFEEFGSLGVSEIMGSGFASADSVAANKLQSMVFLNNGKRFDAVPLPLEAQLSPAFYAGVADYDGDGHDDIFISQNFFSAQPETPRIDAGRGLWIRGNGNGLFKAVSGHLSGIKVYGEQRGAALADFNNDGRIDLAVSQNAAWTKLYRNKNAKPGLRVRFAGSPQNPASIGAIVQVLYENSSGPAREIHAGSGYWSQDSQVPVLGIREFPAVLKVIWPGGKITHTQIPENISDLTVNTLGEILSGVNKPAGAN